MQNNPKNNLVRGSTPANDPATQYRWMGYEDARNGCGFHPDYDKFPIHQQRNYERGRQQAVLIAAMTGEQAPYWPRNMLFSSFRRAYTSSVVGEVVSRETSLREGFWANA